MCFQRTVQSRLWSLCLKVTPHFDEARMHHDKILKLPFPSTEVEGTTDAWGANVVVLLGLSFVEDWGVPSVEKYIGPCGETVVSEEAVVDGVE